MFKLFKKKKSPEIRQGIEPPVAPFEILLPDQLTKGEVPDLRIGSKVLDILHSSQTELQTLEMFEGMPVVNSNNAQLKEFANVVNGARQTSAPKSQIAAMAFPPKQEGSIGVLCCLVNGVLNEFHILNRGGGATLNYQFTKVVHAKA